MEAKYLCRHLEAAVAWCLIASVCPDEGELGADVHQCITCNLPAAYGEHPYLTGEYFTVRRALKLACGGRVWCEVVRLTKTFITVCKDGELLWLERLL